MIFSWFTYADLEHFLTCSKYLNMEETMAYMQKVFKEQGPFDGVCGFRYVSTPSGPCLPTLTIVSNILHSQGGVLASILCGMRKSIPGNDTEDNYIDFKFAMIVSAFPASVSQYNQLYSKIEPSFPSLHIYGAVDTLIEPGTFCS